MVSPADLTGGGSSEEDEQARRWAAALALVEQLADLPEEEREDALRNADIEPEARELARRMLASEHRRSILDDPLPPLLGSEDIAASLTGRQIGRWMLTSPLGRGGMSVVYHARSLVVPLGQEAAVKLLSLAASTPGGRARFEREIRILAKLRHPGIAPIFDAGVADDGTPWFSMALVEGTDVATWQREHAPGPREAVELLLQICDAVEYAHQHLVIHRDIKPSNVLVNADGHAVLLDFGIARLLEEDDGENTAAGSYAFSPRFAAPEQLSGGEITTATDVYGLGSLLHLMLTGQPPQFPEGAADAECLPPASVIDGTRDRSLHRQLSGDLGAILMRSLARDPARRYPGAGELAADLRACLEGLPVAAHRDSGLYRFGKLVMRHKTASVLLAALALSLFGGIAGFAWQARQAQAEADRANLTREFLLDVFMEADVVARGNRPPDIRAVLRKAAALAPKRFAGRPDLQAETLRLVGRLQRLNMDNRAAAATLRKALALDEARHAPWDDERRRTARQLSTALRALGQPEEGAAVTRAWMAADPERPRMTSAFHCVGMLDLKYDSLEQRRAGYEAVLDRCRQFPAGDPQRLLFVSRLATVRRVAGDPQGAFELASDEDAALRALPSLPLGLWSGWSELKSEMAQSLSALGRWDEAATVAAEGVHLAEENAGPDSAFVVGPLRVLGGRLRDADRFGEARQALERALAINQSLGDGRIRAEDASILLDLGATAFVEEDFAGAATYLDRALDAYAEAGITGGIDKGTTLDLLSIARRELGDNRSAADAARRALAFYREDFPDNTAREAQALLQLCLAMAGLGETAALEHCERGLALDGRDRPDDAELLAEDRRQLAEAKQLLGRKSR